MALTIGIAMVIFGATDFDDGRFFLLVGAVVTASNGFALYRRRSKRL
ncbi:MAG: hypothetical protein QOJ72_2943 [Nocardioidaceae bacterium]|jgi:hypothetical protein|nr:hypothetical protein [Nocardioidaceae bacterium]